MFYAQISTINNRQICISTVEQDLAPDESLPWIPFQEQHPEYLGCEYKDGKFIALSEEELKSLYGVSE